MSLPGSVMLGRTLNKFYLNPGGSTDSIQKASKSDLVENLTKLSVGVRHRKWQTRARFASGTSEMKE
jgi:hypothetical protein